MTSYPFGEAKQRNANEKTEKLESAFRLVGLLECPNAREISEGDPQV